MPILALTFTLVLSIPVCEFNMKGVRQQHGHAIRRPKLAEMWKHIHILAKNNMGEGTVYQSLKPKQVDSILAARKSDVITILLTGYRKTVIIQMLPYTKDSPGIVVMVNPLNTITAE